MDVRESVLYYSYQERGDYFIAALDITGGSNHGNEIMHFMLPSNMAATKIDVSGEWNSSTFSYLKLHRLTKTVSLASHISKMFVTEAVLPKEIS